MAYAPGPGDEGEDEDGGGADRSDSRLIGRRWLHTGIDEHCTIVDVQTAPNMSAPIALIQFKDGAPWDETLRVFTDSSREDSPYYPLPGRGPELRRACRDGTHEFGPVPLSLSDDVDERQAQMHRQCTQCGLSGHIIRDMLTHKQRPRREP